MQASDRIRVIDADLTNPGNPYSMIRVWYTAYGKRCRLEICGSAFFNWLSPADRRSFAYDLNKYWMELHPRRRDRHVGAYLEALLHTPARRMEMA